MNGINLKDARPNVKNPRSNFDLSFNRKFDTKFGQLYPFLCMPVMPSDKVNIGSDTLVRFAPFVSQVFQRYVVATDYYYVPSRVVWNKFDNFMTAGYDGKQEYVMPSLNVDKLHSLFVLGSSANILNTIFDALDFSQDAYMNCNGLDLNALPFFAYYRIILDYWLGVGMPLTKLYEQLMNEGDMINLVTNYMHASGFEEGLCAIAGALQSGNPDFVLPEKVDPQTLFSPIPRLYPLDYFTEARPDPQLGPVMTIPLQLVNTDSDGTQTFRLVNNSSFSNSGYVAVTTQGGSNEITVTDNNTGNKITVNGSVFNNVASINDFYSAARVQELLTLYGFSGFMPQDTVAAEFGVKNSDSRLHRSQFLYHDQFDMSIGEVFSNNVNLGGQGPVGSGAETDSIPGVGTAYSKGNGFSRGFDFNVPEHGYIFGLMSVYPEASYCQGYPRHLTQLDRFDYPHPLLSQLGMQEIKQGEIFSESTNHSWDETFAYTPRYSDYKVGINRVNGQLRTSLKYMTAGRLFDNDPVNSSVRDVRFNDSFLRVLPGYNNLNKTFNVTSDLPHDAPIFVDIQNRIYANRPLPYYGLPKF